MLTIFVMMVVMMMMMMMVVMMIMVVVMMMMMSSSYLSQSVDLSVDGVEGSYCLVFCVAEEH